MSKPYIICYMMTTLDSRIVSPFLEKVYSTSGYGTILSNLASTTLVGRVTAEFEMSSGRFKSRKPYEPLSKVSFSKKGNSNNGYDIIVDSKGCLRWDTKYEYEKPYLIMTSENVSKEYLSYLNSKNISWIACGKKRVDLKKAVEILYEQFDVKRLAVIGGTIINTAFLDAGLLDEIAVLIGPGIDGCTDKPILFDGRSKDKKPVQLKLKDVKKCNNDCVLLSYTL